MALKTGTYYSVTGRDFRAKVAGLTVRLGKYYLVSNEPEFDGAEIPAHQRMGFNYSWQLSTVGGDMEALERNIASMGMKLTPITKTAALCAIAADRIANPHILGYSVSYAGGKFNFGCGAVKTTPEEVQQLVKFLSTFSDKEITTIRNTLYKVEDNVGGNAIANLRKQLPDIKNLLKMPAYASRRKPKVAKKR